MTSFAAGFPIIAIINPALSGLFGAVLGVIVTHRLAGRRDREQKRREIALQYLIEAWQRLEEGCRTSTDIHRKSEILERTIVDIQLFGSPTQIAMAKRWTENMVLHGGSDTTPLLRDFQTEIRRELGLRKSPIELFFFRLTPLAAKVMTAETKT